MDLTNVFVVDFEFISFNRIDTVLISGAVASVDPNSPVKKLAGQPLLLRDLRNVNKGRRPVEKMSRSTVNSVIIHIMRIFKGPENVERHDALLFELEQSFTNCDRSSSLDAKTIKMHLGLDKGLGRMATVVSWNGHCDAEILKKLDVPVQNLFLSAYDTRNDGIFTLRLYAANTPNETMAHVEIGWVTKNGRMLSLSEAHGAFCWEDHDSSRRPHDPVKDVLMTRCLYIFLLEYNEINKYESEECWDFPDENV